MLNPETLAALPLAERLAAMESLWDSLCRDAPDSLSPDWHAPILAARKAEIAAGAHRDWADVRAALRQNPPD
jgi:hypothetical protein